MGDAQRLQMVQNAAILYKSLYALIATIQASHVYQNENNMHPIKTICRVFDSRGPDTRGSSTPLREADVCFHGGVRCF